MTFYIIIPDGYPPEKVSEFNPEALDISLVDYVIKIEDDSAFVWDGKAWLEIT